MPAVFFSLRELRGKNLFHSSSLLCGSLRHSLPYRWYFPCVFTLFSFSVCLCVWNHTFHEETSHKGLRPPKAMAPHSSTLAWKISRMEEPGRLQSMGSRRVGHNWTTSLSLFTFMHWVRKWQPTWAFLPGESQGWGRTQSDMTEVT